MSEPRTIGVFLFDDLDELDAVGPWEVLAHWTRAYPEDGYRLVSFAPTAEPVRGANGLRLVPDHTVADRPRLDVLLLPGGPGARARVDDPAYHDWLRTMRTEVDLLTSVCTGSLPLAAAGLLAGRPATTHHASLDRLAELDPTIDVRRDARFVDDGDLATSAGISAGIDLALHLVARLGGVEQARAVRRRLQYEPAPPV